VFAANLPGQVSSPQTAELQKTFAFNPGDPLLPGYNPNYSLNVERGSESTLSIETNGATNRKVLRATLNPRTDLSDGNALYGGKRVEFEWYPTPARFYLYPASAVEPSNSAARDLWVGFRVRVVDEGNESLVSFFQFGPVRDQTFLTKSEGYFQLCVRRSGNPLVTRWSWRTDEAPALWENLALPPTAQQIADLRLSTPDLPIYRNSTPGYINLDAANAQVKTPVSFVRNREESWVGRLRMRTDGTGRVTLWNNGKLVIDVNGPNAFPLDVTRVKWGPYTGTNLVTAPISAEYVHLSIVEGNDDGYRRVAPGTFQTMPASGPFSRAVSIPAGTNAISVRGLPYGWTFNGTTKLISGPNSDLVRGARILISFSLAPALGADLVADPAATHVVWIFPGEAEDSGADMDNDGVSNQAEVNGGTDPSNSISTPFAALGLTAEDRVRLTFVRARADATYSIEASGDLASWQTIATNPGAVASAVVWDDPTPIHLFTVPRRFYRLRVSVPDL
jgi:hypothetical protein